MTRSTSWLSASALLVSLLSSPATAQLHTDCNPTLKDCPADPAFGTAHTFNFNATPATGLFKTSAGTVDYSAANGAKFTIPKQGYSPTLATQFYIFWGRAEVILKAANGTGIISSIVLGSDDLDEIDWEFKGGDTANAYTNYYGKGVTENNGDNGLTVPVTGNVQTEWHNYTNVWTKEKLEWWLDGKLVRTLTPAESASHNQTFPQTPMKLSMGIWAGGDSSQSKGTIDWAGGATNYDTAPFTMYVQSARVEDYSKGKEYVYGDRSGKWESIKIVEPTANSTAIDNLNKPAEEEDKSISEKWDELSSGAKGGVYAGGVGVVAIAFLALLFYYLRQRKRGKAEAALAAKNQEYERLELDRFKKEGRDPDALAYEGAEYDAATMRKDGMVSTAAYTVPSADHDDHYARSNSLQGAPQAGAWDPTSPAPGAPAPLRNNSFGPASPVSPVRNFSSPVHSVHNGGYSGVDTRMASPGPSPYNSPQSPAGGGYGNGGTGYGGANNGYWNGNGNGNGYR
ncbi:hypothetical protein JX265_008338 [Neoarthrinium moseri]|uniref:chitinase n=1 Tax=Neoarthrinium moseri TaxID=1658444 RepID=A0A9P9WI19_9PEZI|nr:hypothetical protein JX265_008338 [Neoarthrinium moseri]